MKRTSYGLALLIVAFTSASAWATTVTFQAAKDAMIFATKAGADTGSASGKGPGLFAGADGGLGIKRSELQFDVSSIPPAATITSATLTLYLAQVAGSGGGPGGGGSLPSRNFALYDLRQDWGEGSSGSPTSPSVGGTGQGFPRVTGDSSWDYAFFNSADTTAGKWNQSGTDLHGGNFSSTQSAQSTFTNFVLNDPYTWSSPGMVTDIQAWVNGGASNLGWLLKAETGLNGSGQTVNLETTSQSFLGFWSKDGAAANSNPNIAPMLTVTYTLVPEPSTLALVSIAGVSLLVRRWIRRSAA